MIEAIRDAHDVMMGRDENVVVFGEDVGYFGGVFRCTKGLQQKYGRARCFDTPINESGIIGTAIGMAAYGLRPCVEIQFADYMYPAYDQLVSEAARLRHRSAGDFTAPMTIRMPTGGGIFGAQTHSPKSRGAFHPRLRPEDRRAVKSLRRQGLADRGHRGRRSVIFLEPKRLYNGPFDGHHDRPIVPWSTHPLGEVPEGHYSDPAGSASVRRARQRASRCWLTAPWSMSRKPRPRNRASMPKSSTSARCFPWI